MLRWPDRDTVSAAVEAWADHEAGLRPQLLKLGYFGSYATGRWGVGSDVDLVAVVAQADRPFSERGRDWDVTTLPVPADILIYTLAEWEAMVARGDRFARVMATEIVWVLERG